MDNSTKQHNCGCGGNCGKNCRCGNNCSGGCKCHDKTHNIESEMPSETKSSEERDTN